MTNNLETKVNETLPAVNVEANLDKLLKEANALEYGVSGFFAGLVSGIIIYSFGGCAQFCLKQDQRMNVLFGPSCKVAGLKGFSYRSGFHSGAATYAALELCIGIGLNSFLGPAGLGIYFGAKVITNYLGYKYYKKQRQIHDELDKIYLLEKNDK